MDKLEQAMQSENFWTELADVSFGKVVLHGKNTNSIADNEYYEVSSEINTDGDFAITFFKTYEKMKKWFDEWQGDGFYNYLVELYEKQLELEDCMKTTGIIRRFDDLGRITIPKEVRKQVFGKADVAGEPMEIFIDGENIVLQRYKTIQEQGKGGLERDK